jgi:hypothetical protein
MADARSLQPVNEALVRRPGSDQPVERDDERTDRGRAVREPIRVENDDPVVTATLTAEPAIELKKVVPVVGHQRPLGRLAYANTSSVCKTPKLTALTDRFDLAAACPELLGHDPPISFVEQRPHRVRLCSRQRRSAASASSSLMPIRSSISAGYSL